ncbi:MAG: hypothetical protein KBC17_02310 [Candidatus Pacebacteria bacterium]|nr:hypothetical protein [Candidatus Paceibacterota bacterium]
MTKEKVQQSVTEMILKLGFKPEAISVTYDENTNSLWFALTSSDTRFLVAKEAEALGAINHIATKIAEKVLSGTDNRMRVVIDANDFEKKKIDNLKTIAHMMAERARYFKSSIDVEPMSPHERRIMHEFISAMPDMKTESVGEGKNRHVVIKYVDPKI